MDKFYCEEALIFKTNREKSKISISRSFWCKCDMSCVTPGMKCSYCGNRKYGKFKVKHSEIKKMI